MPILRKRELSQLLPDERQKKLRELRTELAKMRTTVESGAEWRIQHGLEKYEGLLRDF